MFMRLLLRSLLYTNASSLPYIKVTKNYVYANKDTTLRVFNAKNSYFIYCLFIIVQNTIAFSGNEHNYILNSKHITKSYKLTDIFVC